MALHGHTKIELTNVNTGEIETYEDDNLVTNAIGELFHPMGFCQNRAIYDNFSLLSTTAGLMLFDEPIEENPNITLAPGGVRTIGHANRRVYTGSDPTFGSYNSGESGKLYNGFGYKHVWDFGTSQANGEISTACLTTTTGGFMGTGYSSTYSDYPAAVGEYYYSSYSNNMATNSNTKYCVYFDGEKDEITWLNNYTDRTYFPLNNNYSEFINNTSSFLRTGNLYFSKTHFPLNSVSLFEFQTSTGKPVVKDNIVVNLPQIADIIPEEAFTVPSTTTLASTGHYYFNYKTYNDDGYIYFVLFMAKDIQWGTSTSTSTATHGYANIVPDNDICYIWKINADTMEVDDYYRIINVTGYNVRIGFSGLSSSYTNKYVDIGGEYNNILLSNDFIMVQCFTNFSTSYPISRVVINLADQSDFSFIKYVKDKNNEDATEVRWGGVSNFIYQLTHHNKVYWSNNINTSNNINVIDLVDKTHSQIQTTFYALMGSDSTDKYNQQLIKVRGINPMIAQLYMTSSTSGFYVRLGMFPNVLITINNLPEKVVKTQEQTMKVIYTLIDDAYAQENNII